MVVFSKYFYGSALDDVESQLITYFKADKPRSRKVSIEFDTDEVTNRTGGNSVNDYVNREKVASEVILPFWKMFFTKMVGLRLRLLMSSDPKHL